MHCSNCRRGVIQISYFISLWSPKIKFYIQRNIYFMFQHSEIWIACVGFYLSKSWSSLLVVNKRRKCFSHSHEVEAIVLSEFGKCLFQHICIIHVEFFPVKELLLQSDCNVDLLVILKKARGFRVFTQETPMIIWYKFVFKTNLSNVTSAERFVDCFISI